MPLELVLLIVLAGVGVAGSVALMICNQWMGRRLPEETPEEAPDVQQIEADAEREAGEIEDKEPVFIPLDRQRKEPPAAIVTEAEREAGEPVVGPVRLNVGNAQDQGSRSEQQDAFAITPLEEEDTVRSHGVMAVVCDGMGGMQQGAEAANLAAVQFMRAYLAQPGVQADTLKEAALAANRKIWEFSGGEGSVGTTLVAAAIRPEGLWFVSVGDSHIYLFRSGRLYQLNRDHNYYAQLLEQVKRGELTLEEARRNPERAHLTSYLGMEHLELVDRNIEPLSLRAGDRVLLCSDGLFKALSVKEMEAVLSSKESETEGALVAAALAKRRARQDNITAVLLYCNQI